jgi:serine/threonine-protein kinase
LDHARSGEEENVSLLSLAAYARGRNGDVEVAEAHLETLRDWAETRYVSPYYVAVSLLGLGRESEAFEALEGAEEERSPQLVYLASEPIFDPLRGEPAFQALLERLRLPVGRWESTGVVKEGVA